MGECWFCGAEGAKKVRHPNGKYYRELMCKSCRFQAKKVYPIEDNEDEVRIKELEKELYDFRMGVREE